MGQVKLEEKTPFTRTTNTVKYLGVPLTKQVKNLYNKILESLKKEIEDFRIFITLCHC